jgi:hypothetical protein
MATHQSEGAGPPKFSRGLTALSAVHDHTNAESLCQEAQLRRSAQDMGNHQNGRVDSWGLCMYNMAYSLFHESPNHNHGSKAVPERRADLQRRNGEPGSGLAQWRIAVPHSRASPRACSPTLQAVSARSEGLRSRGLRLMPRRMRSGRR